MHVYARYNSLRCAWDADKILQLHIRHKVDGIGLLFVWRVGCEGIIPNGEVGASKVVEAPQLSRGTAGCQDVSNGDTFLPAVQFNPV